MYPKLRDVANGTLLLVVVDTHRTILFEYVDEPYRPRIAVFQLFDAKASSRPG